jgi:hypothetical protein
MRAYIYFYIELEKKKVLSYIQTNGELLQLWLLHDLPEIFFLKHQFICCKCMTLFCNLSRDMRDALSAKISNSSPVCCVSLSCYGNMKTSKKKKIANTLYKGRCIYITLPAWCLLVYKECWFMSVLAWRNVGLCLFFFFLSVSSLACSIYRSIICLNLDGI